MQCFTFFVRCHFNHVIGFTTFTTKARRLFSNIIRVLPVKTIIAHTFCQIRNNPPVWFSVSRCIIELLIKSQTTFTVCTHEVFFTPGCCRENNIRISCTNRISQIDILINDHHTTGVSTFFQRSNHFSLVVRTHLMGIIYNQFIKFLLQTL